jgi:hypothetical protein
MPNTLEWMAWSERGAEQVEKMRTKSKETTEWTRAKGG